MGEGAGEGARRAGPPHECGPEKKSLNSRYMPSQPSACRPSMMHAGKAPGSCHTRLIYTTRAVRKACQNAIAQRVLPRERMLVAGRRRGVVGEEL